MWILVGQKFIAGMYLSMKWDPILLLKKRQTWSYLETKSTYKGIKGSKIVAYHCQLHHWKEVHCKHLRALGGLCRFSLLWGNPVIFTDCGEILWLSWGFPAICKYYRIYPQHTVCPIDIGPISRKFEYINEYGLLSRTRLCIQKK